MWTPAPATTPSASPARARPSSTPARATTSWVPGPTAARPFVSLGFGDDRFLGGSGADRVWSQEASNQSSPDDDDVIITGDGDDYVISGSSAAANHDVVDLGPGNDALVTYGSTAGASLTGGTGANTLQPLFGSEDVGEWTIDNTTGRADLERDEPSLVDLLPAFRPDGPPGRAHPLPRQRRERVGGGRRHLSRGAARTRWARPAHGRRERLQQPPRRRCGAGGRAG